MDLDNVIVSVIVPVYNASKYLRECVDTIIGQLYKKIEIILVDDGSSDESLEICKELSLNDSRIKVLHKKNGGASSARNCGILAATGDWLVFVDSDDLLQPFHIEHLLAAQEKWNADFVIAGIQYWNVRTNLFQNKSYKELHLVGNELVDAINKEKIYLNGGPVSKLYKTRIIRENGIFFNEKMLFAEDCDFMLRYYSHIDSIIFTGYTDYIYRLLPDSLSHRKLSYETESYCLNEMILRYRDLKNRFGKANLDEYKSSIMQYFLRATDSAIRDDARFLCSLSKLRCLYDVFKSFYADKEYRLYKPYCRHEMLMYVFFVNKHLLCMILYSKYFYPLLKK